MTTTTDSAIGTALSLPPSFDSNMVLQRHVPIRLWGDAAPQATVQASLAGCHSSARADSQGHWRLQLPPLPAGGPHVLIIQSNGQQIRLANVLIGDVWLCSGQSNMGMTLGATEDGKLEALSACDDLVRYFGVRAEQSVRPASAVQGRWRLCEPTTAGDFSAVAYYFAKMLRQRVGVPIGVIVAASGHTPAQAWMSREALAGDSQTARLLEPWDAALACEPAAVYSLAPYRAALADDFSRWNRDTSAWLPRAQEARAAGLPLPPQPPYPNGLGNPQNPTVLFNGMIAPLAPTPLCGVIWYQGETNAIFGQSVLYRRLFPNLIADWRRWFENPQLPFLFVQIANHADVQSESPQEKWAELREAQLMSLRVPHTAMATIIDVGQSRQIHPQNKRAVGRRLALAALAKAYGRDLVHSGPIFREMQVRGDACHVRFDHAHDGLVLRGTQSFEVAGADRRWKPATPAIEGDTLVLRSSEAPSPVACRYAWTDDAIATLFNGWDLPASPFRSDDWPRATAPR
jgi:sialate O-acetylesterase